MDRPDAVGRPVHVAPGTKLRWRSLLAAPWVHAAALHLASRTTAQARGTVGGVVVRGEVAYGVVSGKISGAALCSGMPRRLRGVVPTRLREKQLRASPWFARR